MKINLLPLGARFLLKGRIHTKVGPMTASDEAGAVSFIPKHAVLQPVPGEAPPVLLEESPKGLDAAKVRAAFEAYHQTALKLTDAAGKAALEEARRRFIAGIC
ncbi:hypothetical protein dqs_2661 [Azoarcus olearius]|uniref:hypothetical protein n=1 Tax=Azoarcus sp. (strain BH72) TaxID=418699 RepID=UPI0008063419|nr:hypothetical protein [Azoarcus olearius]ANQ85691.1 hypothetical protein dqs_2661 [Azoarcus olearius]